MTPEAGRDSGGTMAGHCPTGMCDLEAQTGCMAGEACDWAPAMMGGMPVPYCRSVGMQGDGMPCDNMRLCQEGFVCLGPAAGAATCKHVCCMGNDSACPSGQQCSITILAPGMTTSPVGACDAPDNCNILAQTGCGMGEYCYPGGSDGSTQCANPGTGASGSACSTLNACVSGYICADMPGRCLQVCNMATGGTPACPMGQTCAGLMGFTGVGVCVMM